MEPDQLIVTAIAQSSKDGLRIANLAYLNSRVRQAFKPGETLVLTLRRAPAEATDRQLWYWQKFLVPHTVKAMRETGDIITHAQAAQMLLDNCPEIDPEKELNEQGLRAMSRAIDWAIRWLAENTGYVVPQVESAIHT